MWAIRSLGHTAVTCESARTRTPTKTKGVKRFYAINGYSDPNEHKKPIKTHLYGPELITNSIFNKGTGWSRVEIDRLGLRGLVPPNKFPINVQVARVLKRYDQLTDDMSRHLYITSVQDRNETLFYHILCSNFKKYAPIIYTPTIGEICQEFSIQYRTPRGMYFSVRDRGCMTEMMYNWPENEVDVIVVTDGSRILGLGDLGAQGMGICTGKLSLYVAAGGIHPKRVLPICLDVGTNNEKLLEDPLYIGTRQKRLQGKEYMDFIHEFMFAVYQRWPNVMVQFEDFANEVALPILDKYRYKYLCFNDDIQGTGAVALAGVIGALKVLGKTLDDLCNERIVVVGAGSAGIGVANSLAWTMIQELGMPVEAAFQNFYVLDRNGLLGKGRHPGVGQLRYLRQDMESDMSLIDVVKQVKPTILLGLSGKGGIFTEQVVKEMYKHCPRPIIFPLSNPTNCAECTAVDAYTWTDGNCIFASGSPFDEVELNGKTYYPSQGNNMYIFPAIGLATTTFKARRISYRMLNRAGIALAESLTQEELATGLVYPDLNRIREVTVTIAETVAMACFEEQLARSKQPSKVSAYMQNNQYYATYAPVVSTKTAGQ